MSVTPVTTTSAMAGSASKLNPEQQRKIDWLRQGELEDSDKEIDRLLKSGILEIERTETALHKLSRPQLRPDFYYIYPTAEKQEPVIENVKQVKAIYLQSKILQNILKDTHYTFFHSQSTHWMGLLFLINAMEKRFGTQTISNFKYCRSSLTKHFKKSIQDYLVKKEEESWSMDSQQCVMNDLVSVSSDLNEDNSESRWEDAMPFLIKNQNIYTPTESSYQNEIRSRFSFLFNKDVRLVSEKISSFIKDRTLKGQCANLLVFCIPKAESHYVQYRSRPYGIPVQGLGDPTKVIETEDGLATPDQYRIYAPALDPSKHCVYLLSRFPKQYRKELKVLISQELDRLDALSKIRKKMLITTCVQVCFALLCIGLLYSASGRRSS